MAEQTTTLEKGNIYFFYRPKVGIDEITSFEDTQNLYCILVNDKKENYRLLHVGRKKPDGKRDSFWATVSLTSHKPDDIRKELEAYRFESDTGRKREQKPARPCGEGFYELVNHNGDHTHFIYTLEKPRKTGKIQEALNIQKEASYIINGKHPDEPSRKNAGLPEFRKAAFPKRLEEKIRGKKFFAIDPPDYLNYAGAEFIFSTSNSYLREELDMDLDNEREDKAASEIMEQLHDDKEKYPVEPFLKEK